MNDSRAASKQNTKTKLPLIRSETIGNKISTSTNPNSESILHKKNSMYTLNSLHDHTSPEMAQIIEALQMEEHKKTGRPSQNSHNNKIQLEKIFLLNAALCVIKGKPGSMMAVWEDFTNDVIKFISEQNSTCIFLLLGNFAKAKETFIKDKERIIKGVHPSPMAASHGFFGSNIFKIVEEKLNQKIDWSI